MGAADSIAYEQTGRLYLDANVEVPGGIPELAWVINQLRKPDLSVNVRSHRWIGFTQTLMGCGSNCRDGSKIFGGRRDCSEENP